MEIAEACSVDRRAEAEACLHGIHLAAEWVRQPIMVETDTARLVHALVNGVDERSQWAGVIAEIKAVEQLLACCTTTKTVCITGL
jgi:hypothetical protein